MALKGEVVNNLESEIEALTSDAVAEMRETFARKDFSEERLAVARLSASIMASWVKMQQTRNSREALGFALARELATDRAELREYIKVTAPSIKVPSKMLTEAQA